MEENVSEVMSTGISKKTKAILKKLGVMVVYTKPKSPKTKKKILSLSENFNLLQHFGIVRSFLSAKYGLNRDELETLLALYPLGVFSVTDFHKIPKASRVTFKIFKEKQLVVQYLRYEGKHLTVYRLTQNAKSIVKNFHTYLLEPHKIPMINSDIKVPIKEKKKFGKMDKLIAKLKTAEIK